MPSNNRLMKAVSSRDMNGPQQKTKKSVWRFQIPCLEGQEDGTKEEGQFGCLAEEIGKGRPPS